MNRIRTVTTAAAAAGALGAGLAAGAGSASAEQFHSCGQNRADRQTAVGQISVVGPGRDCGLARSLAAAFQRQVAWKGKRPHILRYYWHGHYVRFVMQYDDERGRDDPGVVFHAKRGDELITWSSDQ